MELLRVLRVSRSLNVIQCLEYRKGDVYKPKADHKKAVAFLRECGSAELSAERHTTIRKECEATCGTARKDSNGHATPLRTAEADQKLCSGGMAYLQKHGLHELVQMQCKLLCKSAEKVACHTELKATFCPDGDLDVLMLDIPHRTAPRPRYMKACSQYADQNW